jgi:hypothetical protein
VSGGLLATMAVAGCAQNRQVRMNAAATYATKTTAGAQDGRLARSAVAASGADDSAAGD